MNKVQITFSGFFLVLWLFIFFWVVGGWTRVDCAINISQACDLIREGYMQKDRP